MYIFAVQWKTLELIKLLCTISKFVGKPIMAQVEERKNKPQYCGNLLLLREREGGEEAGEGMPFPPHYTAVIYSSSPVLFSGIKTGCKFDS